MADFDSLESMLNDVIDKLDVLEAERNVSRICTTCDGVGYLISYNDAREETQITCPLCGGATKIGWGFEEAL